MNNISALSVVNVAGETVTDFVRVPQGLIEAGTECSICLTEFDDGTPAFAHPGGEQHPFHAACIDQHIHVRAEPKCPSCNNYSFAMNTSGEAKVQQVAHAHINHGHLHEGLHEAALDRHYGGNVPLTLQIPQGMTEEQYLTLLDFAYPEGGYITDDDVETMFNGDYNGDYLD